MKFDKLTVDDFKKAFNNELNTAFCHVGHLNNVLDNNPSVERPNLKDVVDEYNSIPYKLEQKKKRYFCFVLFTIRFEIQVFTDKAKSDWKPIDRSQLPSPLAREIFPQLEEQFQNKLWKPEIQTIVSCL